MVSYIYHWYIANQRFQVEEFQIPPHRQALTLAAINPQITTSKATFEHTESNFTSMDNIKEFLTFSESLKLNQKAELFDDKGKSIIKDIYTDLFPNNAVNDKVNLSNTTILTGRKGTGKSTIFLKSIEDQIKNQKVFPIYLDIKTISIEPLPLLIMIILRTYLKVI